MDLITHLDKQSRAAKMVLGLALIGAIGVLDILTGYELSFSLFYVIPIAFTAWLMGRKQAIIASLISAIAWLVADVISGHAYSFQFIAIWNMLIRLSLFIIIALLLSTLRSAMEREKGLARTDHLTGAANSLHFLELLQAEIDRLQRFERPFTLVYIDFDNFKVVNDQFGHLIGDQVLRSVAGYTRKCLRKTDVIARLGGDEFALLLPETDQESARISLAKLQSGLLEEMQRNMWPVTFSMGALTCKTAPSTTDELIKMSDELAYQVKRGSKNAIKYSTYMG